MNDAVYLLLGAGLVVIGVIAGALADRIRSVRSTRESRPRPTAKPLAPRDGSATTKDVQQEVIDALVNAGYPKRVATAATVDCALEQRTTAGTWARAALRRCAQAEV